MVNALYINIHYLFIYLFIFSCFLRYKQQYMNPIDHTLSYPCHSVGPNLRSCTSLCRAVQDFVDASPHMVRMAGIHHVCLVLLEKNASVFCATPSWTKGVWDEENCGKKTWGPTVLFRTSRSIQMLNKSLEVPRSEIGFMSITGWRFEALDQDKLWMFHWFGDVAGGAVTVRPLWTWAKNPKRKLGKLYF